LTGVPTGGTMRCIAAPSLRESGLYRHALCIYPYRSDVVTGRFYPPLGLEIIASVLKPHCREIDVIDLRHDAGETKDFIRPETDMVCFSVNWGRHLEFGLEQIRSVPADIFTIVGGRHATDFPEEVLAECPNIDVLVRGDGEEAIDEIARGLPLAGITGISRRQDGNICHNENRHYGPPKGDPRPDRRLRRHAYKLDLEGYDTGVTVDTVASSRGCPYNCRFCSFGRSPWGEKRTWAPRPPEAVVREIEEIDAEIVMFTDDVFTHDMDRVEAICDGIIERGIRKRFLANARLEVSKRMDVVRKMERAGFISLWLGVESAQDKSLKLMKKGFDTKKIEEHFRELRKSRMILNGYFIIGLIGETEEEMLKAAPFAHRLGLDAVALSRLRTHPYDGLRELIEESPGYHVSKKGFIYSDEISLKRIKAIRRRIYREFYTPWHVLKLGWKVLRSGVVGPGRLARLAVIGVRSTRAKRKRRRLRREKRQAGG